MKLPTLRRLAAAACALLLFLPLHPPVRAAREEVTVLLEGQALTGDPAPFLEDGTTYIPLAAFARALGTSEVSWDGTSARVTAPGLVITATPGVEWLEANGRYLHVPGGVRLINGRTVVPARTLTTAYGGQIRWESETGTVRITDCTHPLEDGSTYYDPDTLYWLSRVISAESRGEPLTGQIAVGNVVLNRMASDRFPSTLYEVIFQKGQFEPVENGTIYQEPYPLSVTAAKLCLEGANVVGDCLFFFAPALSPGTWIVNHCTYYTTIGCHRFYL